MNKTLMNTKAASLAVLVFIVSKGNLCCKSFGQTSGIASVELMYCYPVSIYVDSGVKKAFAVTDTIVKSQYKGFVIYTLPEKRDFVTNTKIPATLKYFIFKKGAQEGYLLDSLKGPFPHQKLRVDSLVNAEAMGTLRFGEQSDSAWNLKKVYLGNGRVIDKYFQRVSLPSEIPDSMFYYYDPSLSNIDFSLSRELDSARNSKLFKVRLIFNGRDSAGVIVYPGREMSFEFKAVDLPLSTALMKMCDSFTKSDEKKLQP